MTDDLLPNGPIAIERHRQEQARLARRSSSGFQSRSTPEDLGEDEWAEIFWCGQIRHNWTYEDCKALGAIMWQTLHAKPTRP